MDLFKSNSLGRFYSSLIQSNSKHLHHPAETSKLNRHQSTEVARTSQNTSRNSLAVSLYEVKINKDQQRQVKTSKRPLKKKKEKHCMASHFESILSLFVEFHLHSFQASLIVSSIHSSKISHALRWFVYALAREWHY